MMFGIEVGLDLLGSIRKPRTGLKMRLQGELPNGQDNQKHDPNGGENHHADAQRQD
jgi:hypothetical protein